MNMMGGGVSGGNMMEQLKNNMMTMLMFKSVNGQGAAGSGSSGTDGMMYMVYVFIVTQFVDLFIKYLPVAIQFIRTKYLSKLEDPLLQKITYAAEDITDETHAVKAKTASIVINVGISDHENLIGQALLDYITNNKNTKHIKYLKQNFILNETEVINIADDLFLVMAESSDDAVKIEVGGGGGGGPASPSITQKFEVFSFTKSAKQLRDFLTKITHEYQITTQNKLGTKRFYFNMQGINAPKLPGGKAGEAIKDYSRLPPFFAFTMKEFQTNRKFSNLFGAEIDVIKKRVDFFVKNRKWYDEKGIPYTLGLLLSGAPGTGKTSCIKCLANETNRHIININLNNDITKKQLENLFFNESLVVLNPFTMQNEKYNIPLDQRIYVLEDIDCQGDVVLDRDRDKSGSDTYFEPEPMSLGGGPGFGGSFISGANVKPSNAAAPENQNVDQMDMSFLLNLLDGVLETPGRIMIMTSNYPKRLDKALIRPGRIDIITEFTECTSATLKSMMEYMYGMALTADEAAEVESLTIRITPAEMSKLMFENLESKSCAMAALKVYGKQNEVVETVETDDSIDEIVEENM